MHYDQPYAKASTLSGNILWYFQSIGVSLQNSHIYRDIYVLWSLYRDNLVLIRNRMGKPVK